jgi:hypothetical protein
MCAAWANGFTDYYIISAKKYQAFIGRDRDFRPSGAIGWELPTLSLAQSEDNIGEAKIWCPWGPTRG